MKNRLTAMLLTAALVLGIYPFLPKEAGAATMEAIPAQNTNKIFAYSYRMWKNKDTTSEAQEKDLSKYIPVYAIQQPNGYYANYMKLRDIAYYVDFDVVWNANEPNVMRLYTKRRYIDTHVDTGPATETKTATVSTMDIYVDDVKVETDIVPVMIDNNNYFKIRDIAQLMDFWCEYYTSENREYTITVPDERNTLWTKTVKCETGNVGIVQLNGGLHYVADPPADVKHPTRISNTGEISEVFSGPQGHPELRQYEKTIEYETYAWYDESCGTVSDTPVVYSPRDPSGNYNYTDVYFGETDEIGNAIAQLMLDRDIIEQDHSGVEQFGEGNTLNRYYRYPVVMYREREIYESETSEPRMVLRPDTYSDYSFTPNLKIYPINDKMGVLTIEYDSTCLMNQCIEKIKKTAAPILKEMEQYSCDTDKICYLAAQVCYKMVYWNDVRDGNPEWNMNLGDYGLPAGTKLVELKNYIGVVDYEKIAAMWSDDCIYYGVCQDYTWVTGLLLAAAGYYSAPDYSRQNHVYNQVWVPDEGRWMRVDTSEGGGAGLMGFTRTDHFDDVGGSVTKFFWMMEDLKPGKWLSGDRTKNPWAFTC